MLGEIEIDEKSVHREIEKMKEMKSERKKSTRAYAHKTISTAAMAVATPTGKKIM